MKNAKGQEVRWVIPEDLIAHAKETMSPEEAAKLEAAVKQAQQQALEMYRKKAAELRAKRGRPTVSMRNGGDPKKVIWPTPEEFCAPGCEDSVTRGTGEDETKLQGDS